MLASFVTASGGKVAVMIFPTFISFYSAIEIQETSYVLKKCWLITSSGRCCCCRETGIIRHHIRGVFHN